MTSEGFCLKGKIYLKEDHKKQAILAFEQCIRSGASVNHMSFALIEITKSKINDRDFYSALHHISRAEYLSIQN